MNTTPTQPGLFDVLEPVRARIKVINFKTATKEEKKTAVYIGRFNKYYGLPESPLNNPFKKDDRPTSTAKFREYLPAQLKEDPTTAQEFSSLLGTLAQGESVTLMCWCSPLPCHADVIKELLEAHADLAGD